MRTARCALFLSFVLATALSAGEGWKDIIPTPKQAKVVGGDWTLPAGAVILIDDFPKARIGAAEINERIQALGGKALPIVKGTSSNAPLVLRVTCPPKSPSQAKAWAGGDPKVTAKSPGEQGYVIRFAERGGRREVLLAGSDEMGTLYACVTFRRLLEKGPTGVTVSRVALRDWPDFRWRGAPSVSFVVRTAESSSDEGKAARVKRFVDWCLRRKLNVLRDYALYKGGAFPKKPVPWIAESNRYARERGFLTFQFGMTYIHYGKPDPKDPLLKNCAMVNPRKYFTWADDRALKTVADNLAQYCALNGFNLLGLHPPDGGGVMDPSQYLKKRSAYDRKRFDDDHRAEADANVFNIFFNAARKRQPGIRVGFVLYPYSPIYLDYKAMKEHNPELTPELYRRNVTDYYTKICNLLHPDAYLIPREARRDNLTKYRSYFGDRPILTWCDFAGRWHRQPYFTSVARFIGTSWNGNTRDINSSMHTRVRPNLVNFLSNVEFTWNVNAPGAALLEGNASRVEYYTKPGQPAVVYKEFLPRACRNIWGPKAGSLMLPVFQSGLSAAMLVRENSALSYINSRLGRDADNFIQLDSKFFASQAEAAGKALAGLEQVIREKPPMERDAWRTAVYYYRRVRLLDVIARLRYQISLGTELADAGKFKEAMAATQAGKAICEREIPRLRKMTAETQRMDPLHRRYFKERRKDVYAVLTRKDTNFEGFRKALAGLERRLLDQGKKLTPLSHKGVIRVGVYNARDDGGRCIGHNGVLMTFKDKPGVKAEFITDLSLDNLLKYDCVVYPQGTLGRSATRYDFFTGLRRYVTEAGGAVWFMHTSVGTPRSQFGYNTTFPEVARGARTRKDTNKVRIIRHPITRGFEPNSWTRHGYYDHWLIRRAKKAGRSVLMGEGGVVWVAGQVGKGRVLYDGSILLSSKGNQPEAAKGDHEKLMLNALKWLTQRTR